MYLPLEIKRMVADERKSRARWQCRLYKLYRPLGKTLKNQRQKAIKKKQTILMTVFQPNEIDQKLEENSSNPVDAQNPIKAITSNKNK